MYIAVDKDNQRISIENAQAEHSYYCPVCNSPLITKNKSDIRRHHFAHKSGYNCIDNWHYDMSDWHRDWQAVFPEDNREIIIEDGEDIHRADIMVGRTVVEFQHSNISFEDYQARNNFYTKLGYKIVWLFDLSEFYAKDRISLLNKYSTGNRFEWKYAKKIFISDDISSGHVKVFFQLKNETAAPIVQVKSIDDSISEFVATDYMSKEDFLDYVGLHNGSCATPYYFNEENSIAYTTFKNNYNINLDDHQAKIMQNTDDPILILGNPGTGKTTVLIDRVGYMLALKKVDPENVLVLTFDKFSAMDVENKFNKKFGEKLNAKIKCQNIYRFFYNFYKKYCARHNIEFPAFLGKNKIDVYNKVLAQIPIRDLSIEEAYKQMDIMFRAMKNIVIDRIPAYLYGEQNNDWDHRYDIYNKILKMNGYMDEEDILLNSYEVLTNDKSELRELASKYKYVCIDNAQELSKLQTRLIRLFTQDSNICMTADERQCLNDIKGADSSNLRDFIFDAKNTYVACLDNNYRLAEAFRNNEDSRFSNDFNGIVSPEVYSLLRKVSVKTRTEQYQYLLKVARVSKATTAFLYKDDDSAIVLADRLLRNNIPFSINIGKLEFFHCKLINAVKVVLSFYCNSSSIENFNKVCETNLIYISDKERAKINDLCNKNKNISIISILNTMVRPGEKRISRFLTLIGKLKNRNIQSMLKNIYYNVNGSYTKTISNELELLLMLASSYNSIPEFLKRLDELERELYKNNSETKDELILLSTIEAVREKEFERVYILDLFNTMELQLIYVGITRAKQRAVLLCIGDKYHASLDEIGNECTYFANMASSEAASDQ